MTVYGNPLSRSLSEAKRTCPLHCMCPLMTQSGPTPLMLHFPFAVVS